MTPKNLLGTCLSKETSLITFFHEDSISSFYMTLLKDRQTNGQTDRQTPGKTTSLAVPR